VMEASTDAVGKIAVIGMAGRYPQAWNIEQFWQNLKEGRECISFFTKDELLEEGVSLELLSRSDYVKAAGISPGTFLFDASFFGYTPREAELLDPQHRVFLECAWQALEHAGYDPFTYSGRIGLFAGSGATHYLFELLNTPGIEKFADPLTLFTCGDKDFLATRVGYKLNFCGPCVSVQTACSTSLVSIVLACQSLLSYHSDIALGGGVTLSTRERRGYLYQEGGVHSPDGHCRPFDADARGMTGGTGAGIIVLKRLEDALAADDTIHAVVLGAGINNDGSTRIGYSAPGVNGQATVISDTIAMAGIDPETIGFVECHGTATPVGDPIEIAALSTAFRAYTQKRKFCAVGSVKSNIGHADAAAGVAGLTKTVLSLKNKAIPASLHFRKPNRDIDFANSPFYVNNEFRQWKRETSPRRAGVSSFGLGGTNAHVILEEAPDQKPSSAASWNLLVWSARTTTALEKMTANLLEHLKSHPEDSLADVSYTLQVGRRLFSHRRMLVCRDHHDAVAALTSNATDSLLIGQRESEPGTVTFLFPGQGCQYVNMGKELYDHEQIFREQVDRCAEILKPDLGLDLREILYPPSEKVADAAVLLDQIRYTNPILFTVEYAVARLWLHWAVRPAAVIGHSTGEYVAACIAEVFSLEDALRLVSARGRLMQQMPAGCMTGVLLSEAQLTTLLASVDGVSLAAVNSPSACVVSGNPEGMAQFERLLTQQGVLHRRLHISHAAHSAMMDPILDEFRREVQKVRLRPPALPYLSNLSGTWATTEVTDPQYWVRHMRETVRFADGLTELLTHPERILLEVGPGRSLGTLITQYPAWRPEHVILPSLRHPKNDSQGDIEFLLTTVAQLWLEGVRIDWKAMHGQERRRIPLPTYPFERQHYQLRNTGCAQAQAAAKQDNLHSSSQARAVAANGLPSPKVFSAGHARPNLPVPYVAPRNELELRIAEAWQDVLGIAGPGINDSFVALGGHSLVAIQLVGRIRALGEIEITVADLFRAPTIAGLAELIVRQLTQDPGSTAMAELMGQIEAAPRKKAVSSEKWRHLSRETKKRRAETSARPGSTLALSPALVPIRASGTATPLFLAHPVGGGVIAYHDLVKYLRPEQPVYALQNLDLGSHVEPDPLRVEDMAAHYIEAIKAISPDGPYLLGGSSMGGAIAFEMAVQLKAAGRQASIVAMIDTPAKVIPHMEQQEGHSALAVELIMLASIIASGYETKFCLSVADLDHLGPAEQIDRAFGKLQQQQLVPASLDSADFVVALKAFVKNLNAFEKYKPSLYDGRVAILRARKTSEHIEGSTGDLCDDPTFGWQAHCAQPVIVTYVPGDHILMNLEPNVGFTGAELQRVLDEAR
jgi:phthiocerol/phenolphthiocerol synthesis type-I polyketide synthase E